MKKMMILGVAALALSLGACNTPGERAVGGALIGGGTGAVIGGLAGGDVSQYTAVLERAMTGFTDGEFQMVATTTPQGSPCPYGTYRDAYGNIYCR